ncbi:MAG: hypothetical protein LBD24_02120 [Spirochaetaceae bacterium]|nr:hypothetical protein [Spirochaetaceae bacterium]
MRSAPNHAPPLTAHNSTAPEPSETARERSRALTATSPLTGQGVALLGNNSAVPPAAGGVLHHLEATSGHV